MLSKEIILLIVFIAWVIRHFIKNIQDSFYSWYSLSFIGEMIMRIIPSIIICGIIYIIFF